MSLYPDYVLHLFIDGTILFARSICLGVLLHLNKTAMRFSRWGHHVSLTRLMSVTSTPQRGNLKPAFVVIRLPVNIGKRIPFNLTESWRRAKAKRIQSTENHHG